ncbi:MAG TPA: L-seryl-tRNA(Sec) selenium transferase [bacterium]|nr:L-seryl-tRNA(Sec) selenium transferase [bacterium]
MPRTDTDRSSALRLLPSVDQLLRHEGLRELPRSTLLRVVRAFVDELRQGVLDGSIDAAAMTRLCADRELVTTITDRCAAAAERRHRRVYNATGIVLHTGIGRAPLAPSAIAAVADAAGYAIVEVDPVTGVRDQRELAVRALLTELTGAGGALVVNNNAAATTLMLAALCAGAEVVISRGELVEIGGGFRVPDVMRRAGCTMVEVGATNKTHLRDYEQATTERTRAYLKVHPSNFRIEGFAGVPSVEELHRLAQARGLMVLDDLGSGLLWAEPLPGLADEPRVQTSLRDGAAVTCFSGDKLLGGPQAGILVGDEALVARCRAHPLYRALRCDKLTLAALEATLAIYRDGEPLREIPTLRMLAASPDELERRAAALTTRLREQGAETVPSQAFAGSGANPAKPLPSFATAIAGGDVECDRLRAARPVSVFARVAEGRVWLDARTLLTEDLDAVAAAVRAALPR